MNILLDLILHSQQNQVRREIVAKLMELVENLFSRNVMFDTIDETKRGVINRIDAIMIHIHEKGQNLLIKYCTNRRLSSMSNPSFWSNIMDHEHQISNLKADTKNLKNLKVRTRSGKSHIESSRTLSLLVPGNVALITFASRMIGLLHVHETAKLCASLQPG